MTHKNLCGGCDNDFATLADFDSHRRGDFGKTPAERICLAPESVGLELRNGVWGTPRGNAHREVLAERFRIRSITDSD